MTAYIELTWNYYLPVLLAGFCLRGEGVGDSEDYYLDLKNKSHFVCRMGFICIFAAVLMADFVPPTYRNTKRYARLVVRNVRNFYEKQD